MIDYGCWKSLYLLSVAAFILPLLASPAHGAGKDTVKVKRASTPLQAVVVTAKGWNTSMASLMCYERTTPAGP
ncbi:MAG: hypothetical protein PHN75_16430, partial [Syntrophales bacterium]|nr:hypothetical protein [Syntrophales bacterium]